MVNQMLSRAAESGDHEAVAQLLADTSLVIDDAAFADALHNAARKGHDKVIAQLLAANPACIDAVGYYDRTALHIAANEGHATVIAQLLAANPACLDAVDKCRNTALHNAAFAGHATVIAQLLAANACIDAVDDDGMTALHMAVMEARHAVTKQLLAAKPELIKVLDNGMSTVFAQAVRSPGHRSEEELLTLGITPEEVDIYGLGSIIRGECCHEIVTLLYNMYHEAATLENDLSQSPFLLAVIYKNYFAIELLQWKLTFDDIVAAFTDEEVHDSDDLPNYVERYQPIMETQCEALFPLLGDDVMGIVFECLGLEARKKKSAKRQRV